MTSWGTYGAELRGPDLFKWTSAGSSSFSQATGGWRMGIRCNCRGVRRELILRLNLPAPHGLTKLCVWSHDAHWVCEASPSGMYS